MCAGAYKNHLFVLRLDLGQHDEIPDTFEEWACAEFNTPATTVSKAQVRSLSVENPNPPEKWVRYIAKYQYRVQIDNKVETSSDHDGDDDWYMQDSEWLFDTDNHLVVVTVSLIIIDNDEYQLTLHSVWMKTICSQWKWCDAQQQKDAYNAKGGINQFNGLHLQW